MKTSKLILGSILLALAATGSAQATSLGELMSGGSLTVGDKTFDDFQKLYGISSGSSNLDYDWSNIDVTGIDDGGDYGLKFSFTNALTATGNENSLFDFTDLFFGFRVSAASPFVINGVSLNASGSADGTGAYVVGEVVGDSADDLIAKADNGEYAPYLDSTGLFDDLSTGLLGKSSYYIGKNLLVIANYDRENALGGQATLTSLEQRYQQTSDVPEPGMLMLLMAGLTGLFFDSKRRGHAQG